MCKLYSQSSLTGLYDQKGVLRPQPIIEKDFYKDFASLDCMESYFVQGKEVKIDPDAKYLIPASIYDIDRYVRMQAMNELKFSQLPIGEFLEALDIDSQGKSLYDLVKLYLQPCKDALKLLYETQDTGATRKIVMGGPVTPPDRAGNIILQKGLENTIHVLEQLQPNIFVRIFSKYLHR